MMVFSTSNDDKKDDGVAKDGQNVKGGTKNEVKLADNYDKNPYAMYHGKEKVDRKEVRKFFMPYIMHPESMHLFYKSMVWLTATKGLAIASPYILKRIVDAITMSGNLDFWSASIGIGLFGLARTF